MRPGELGPGELQPGPDGREANHQIGEELAGWGRVCIIVTTGRVTGRPARAAVGFVDGPAESLLVAAGDPDADWARNLEADPRCRVIIGDRTEARLAVPLDGAEHNRAIVELILRYGTPSERLGAGPSFRLERVPAQALSPDPGQIDTR